MSFHSWRKPALPAGRCPLVPGILTSSGNSHKRDACAIRVDKELGSRINTFYRMTDKEKIDNKRNGVVTSQKRKSK